MLMLALLFKSGAEKMIAIKRDCSARLSGLKILETGQGFSIQAETFSM